jgi:hypothetical protein
MTSLAFVISMQSYDVAYFSFGPHPDLVFLSFHIDTSVKYVGLSITLTINAILRTVHNSVVVPFVIQTIQNNKEMEITPREAYYINSVSVIYTWFDWWYNINIAFTQIDLVLIELLVDLLANTIVTYFYIVEKRGVTNIFNAPLYQGIP